MGNPISKGAALLAVGVGATFAGAATAAPITSVNLAQYVLTGTFFLPRPSALEASGVTFNPDTGTLFVVGDEGKAIVEVTKTGQLVSEMTLSGFGDTEAITYIGGGQFVLTEERERDLYKLSYVAGGSVARSTLAGADLGDFVGNIGLEGVSYDPRDGTYVTVKEKTPQEVNRNTVIFGTPGGAPASGSTITSIFAPASLGLSDLSDVQVLAAIPSLIGTPDENNLLIFSQESGHLVEVNGAAGSNGSVLSFFDLVGVANAEGITMDHDGNIYVVDENDAVSLPRMFVLSPVPLPPALWLLGSALAGMAGFLRRRGNRRSSGWSR